MSILANAIDRYLTTPLIIEERKHLLALVERDPAARLLDCGCGNGAITLKIAEKIGTRELVGIDTVPRRMEQARARGIKVLERDLDEKLPFENESFDVVLAIDVVEHLGNTDGFVKEVHRVLRRGGYIVVATPNLASFSSILYLLVGRQPVEAMVSDEILAGSWNPRWKYRNNLKDGPGHRRIFTEAALRELLKYYGFSVERTLRVGFHPFPFPLAKVMCLIDRWHVNTILMKARKVSK